MRIEKVDVFAVTLPLKAVLTLPRGPSRTLDEGKRVVVVRMSADDGTVGWGEAGPSRRWSAETVESCHAAIARYFAPALVGRDPFDFRGLHACLDREIAPGLDPGQPIAKAAIDVAAHDLVCRRLGIPLNAYLGGTAQTGVPLARLVSAADPDRAAEITRAGLEEGYRGFKVKVGRDPGADLAIVEAVVAAAEGAYVWADANQGYGIDQALVLARAFARLGIAMFEQPVAMTDVAGMKRLIGASDLTIVLDEAAIGIPYLLHLLGQGAVEGIAIKVSKTGGLFHARQMCDLARNAGLALIGSGLMDAPIGFAASVHLFAAYGITLPVDLNGPQFIADDYLARPWPMDGRTALVPDAPGLGLEIDEDKLRALPSALD